MFEILLIVLAAYMVANLSLFLMAVHDEPACYQPKGARQWILMPVMIAAASLTLVPISAWISVERRRRERLGSVVRSYTPVMNDHIESFARFPTRKEAMVYGLKWCSERGGRDVEVLESLLPPTHRYSGGELESLLDEEAA